MLRQIANISWCTATIHVLSIGSAAQESEIAGRPLTFTGKQTAAPTALIGATEDEQPQTEVAIAILGADKSVGLESNDAQPLDGDFAVTEQRFSAPANVSADSNGDPESTPGGRGRHRGTRSLTNSKGSTIDMSFKGYDREGWRHGFQRQLVDHRWDGGI